ncbi:hypothetical protein NS277_16155 [Novosphingobium barchaimii]|nr:hypothetical protein NS277_16155 [Novosphingobium barchaimii]
MSSLSHRRVLVLSDEGARHPFRRSLPPHVCATLIADEPSAPRSIRRIINEDWRGFLAAYCATFVVIIVFLA